MCIVDSKSSEIIRAIAFYPEPIEFARALSHIHTKTHNTHTYGYMYTTARASRYIIHIRERDRSAVARACGIIRAVHERAAEAVSFLREFSHAPRAPQSPGHRVQQSYIYILCCSDMSGIHIHDQRPPAEIDFAEIRWLSFFAVQRLFSLSLSGNLSERNYFQLSDINRFDLFFLFAGEFACFFSVLYMRKYKDYFILYAYCTIFTPNRCDTFIEKSFYIFQRDKATYSGRETRLSLRSNIDLQHHASVRI